MKALVLAILTVYRRAISPMLGQRCRYYPSCSAYALEAVQSHGVVRGGWLGLRRLGRCHPWTPGGVDMVPTRETYRWWGIAEGTDGEDHRTDPNPMTAPPHHLADFSARPGA